MISPVDAPACRFYAAESREALASAVDSDAQSFHGPVRLALVANTEAELDARRRHAAPELAGGGVPVAPGLYFGEGDLDGDVAFCYTGAAAAYPGAARDLLMAFPRIGHNLAKHFAGTPQLARDLYGADITSFSPATQLTGASFVSQAHTEFTRNILGMKPQVALGLSSGETNSLMAFGVWNDLDDMLAEIHASEMYVNQLTDECRSAATHWGLADGEIVKWRCWRIAAPLAVIEEAVEREERVYVTVVHHYEDVVIGGDTDACDRVIDAVGRQRAMGLGLDMVVHCAPLRPFTEAWRAIHVRDTSNVPDIRFYTNAGNRAYVPSRDAAADAITQQALETIDFPKTVERAYEDGVRVFVEHGPRAIVTGAIGKILEGRPHVVVALDPHGGAGLEPLARSVAKLWAAGVSMELAEFSERMAGLRRGALPLPVPEGAILRLAAHPPDIVWPEARSGEVTPTDAEGAHVMATPPVGGWDYDLGGLLAGGHAPSDNGAPHMRESRTPGPPTAGTAAADDGSTAHEAAMALFDSVAEAHSTFLKEQKETHDAFLALAMQGGIRVGTEPAPAAPFEARPPDLRLVVTDASPAAPSELPEPDAIPASAEAPPAPTLPSPLASPVPGLTPNLPEPGTVWLTRE